VRYPWLWLASAILILMICGCSSVSERPQTELECPVVPERVPPADPGVTAFPADWSCPDCDGHARMQQVVRMWAGAADAYGSAVTRAEICWGFVDG